MFSYAILVFSFQPAYADKCDPSSPSIVDLDFLSTSYGGIPITIVGYYTTKEEAYAANIAATGGGGSYYFAPTDGCYVSRLNDVLYIAYVITPTNCIPLDLDADDDNIDDEYDLTPNSSTPYSAAIVSVCYDSNNNIVAGIIQDQSGARWKFGTLPEDMEGYTIESVSGSSIHYQTGESLAESLANLNIDNFELTKVSDGQIEVENDGTYIPGTTGPLDDWQKREDDQTQAELPDILPITKPSEVPQINDTDRDLQEKIVSNTNATNENLNNLAKYLGISNDLLAKINNKTKSGSATSDSGGSLSYGPSATDIGNAVKDSLIDSSQTISNAPDGTEPLPDKTDDLNSTKTKFSDRFGLLTDTLRGSDLFSLPFAIFEGPTGSGSSSQTIDIGNWGESSSQTVTIDYSDYDTAWETLRAVILLLTSFACFKIIIFKRA